MKRLEIAPVTSTDSSFTSSLRMLMPFKRNLGYRPRYEINCGEFEDWHYYTVSPAFTDPVVTPAPVIPLTSSQIRAGDISRRVVVGWDVDVRIKTLVHL